MRLRFLWAISLLLWPLMVSASLLDRDATESVSVAETPIGNTATALPSGSYATIPPVQYAFCVVEGGSIRYNASGTNPTAAGDGVLVSAGQAFEVVGVDDLTNIRFIRTSSTTAAYINCDYRR